MDKCILRRDNEVSFKISAGGMSIKEYFDRKILPNDLKKIKDKGLTEEEIANNIITLTVDNVFCAKCEKS